MKALFRPLSIVVLVAAAPAAPAPQSARRPGAPALDEKSFDRSFDSIRKLGDAGKWSDEKRLLQKLLDEVGAAPFVLARRTELIEEFRRAAVRAAVPQPDPAQLIEGKLLEWDKKTGDLSVRYGPGQWGDFEAFGPFLLHPALFDGPVKVELAGDHFDWAGGELLNFVVGLHRDEALVVAIGARKQTESGHYPAFCVFERIVGGRREELASFERAPNFGKPFDLEIAIGTTEIAVNSHGSRLGQVKRPDGFQGRIGVSTRGPFKFFSLRGRASTSWLQGKLDAVTHDADQKFLAQWKEDLELPLCLRAGAAPATAGGAEPKPVPLPWKFDETQSKLHDRLRKLIDDGAEESAVAQIRKLPAGALPGDDGDYLLLTALDAVEGLSGDAPRVDAFCARHPDFCGARLLHAHLLMEREQYDDAARELGELQSTDPDRELVVRDLVQVDLLRGEPEEAQRALRDARAAGVTSEGFDDLDRTIVRVLRGPNFPRRYQQESPHFTVATDLDNDTARAALKVLEESYAICSKVFGAAEGNTRRFPVYLFSGQAGYGEYAGSSDLAHSTAGMYSPLFKHLLIWNLPERDQIARTLRHEATHQYLDLLGYRVPVWFNEGLAVYVELIASSRKEDLKGGALDRAYLGLLDEKRATRIPLAAFLNIPRRDFYGKAQITYPEAWALVHFLRHGDPPEGPPSPAEPPPQEINARLMEAVAQRLAPDAAIARAFAGVDLEKLDRRFAAHIARLRREVDR